MAMPSTAFVPGIGVDALRVAEADGVVWMQAPGARAQAPQPPELTPPDCVVVAEVQASPSRPAARGTHINASAFA